LTVEETAGRSFGIEAALLAAARFVSVAALFGVHVLAARLLGPEALGAAAAGQTVGIIAALVANGGLNIAAIYLLRRSPAERDVIVPRIAGLGAAASALAVVLVLVVGPVALAWAAGAVDVSLVAAAGALGATMIAFEVSGAVLLGIGSARGYTLMEVVRGVGTLIAVAALLAGPWATDAGFVVGLALGYAIAAALGVTITGRRGAPLAPRFDGTFARDALAFGIRGQVGNVLQFLGVRLDLLLVPALLDLRAAGIYVVAVRTSDVVGQVATAVASLVFPSVAGQDDVRATRFTESVTRMTLVAVAIPALVIGLAAEPILRVLFGDVYGAGTTTLVILLVAMVPLSLTRVLAADLKGRGRPGLVSWASAGSAVATVLLDLALVPTLGLAGAAVASVLAYTIGAVTILALYRTATGAELGALVPGPADVRRLVAFGTDLARRRRPA
jgi:stage V sporulation protein B